MKKPILIIVIVIGGLLVLSYVAARLSHVFEIYTIATTSNMPTFKPGTRFFASKLKKPNHGCFVCYRSTGEKAIWIHRVIGMPNDVIEIKDGIVYRNGQQLNEPYTWNEYILSEKDHERLAGYFEQKQNDSYPLSDTLFKAFFTEAELKLCNLNCTRYIYPKMEPADTSMIYAFRSKGYTLDNFGPVKVPADSYFVMGDNRHDALDSRYMGFVKADAIVSTKIGD